MKFMLITADEDLAQEAVRCGVERIVIDMEVLGKAERQGHIDAHSAAHTFDDLRRMRDQLPETEIMVRINPLHSGSKLEIDKAVAGGADRIMLPMFHTAATVRRFLTLVAGRVPSTLLAETSGALTSSRAWVPDLGALDQVHFGLNDLALSMGLDFLFEPLLLDILARPAAQLQQADIDFGVGGIGRLGREAIPA